MEKQKVKRFRDFLREEDGMGTVEVIMIIVVLVGLVVLFKNQITAIVQALFSKITSQVDTPLRLFLLDVGRVKGVIHGISSRSSRSRSGPASRPAG